MGFSVNLNPGGIMLSQKVFCKTAACETKSGDKYDFKV